MNPDGKMWRLIVLVGVASGLVGAAYVGTLHLLQRVLGPEHRGDLTQLVLLGVVGAVIGGLTLYLGSPGDVELLVDNIHVTGGRDDIRDLRTLIPVSLIGIAAGSAIGPEAPLVQTTGSIGSWVAHRHRLTVDDLRVLTITGMAAGFTVLFGTPLGASIFALEILHRNGLQYYEALLPSAIGALAGYAVYIVVKDVGMGPVWSFPASHPLESKDLLVGVGAGVVGAVVAIGFTYLTVLLRWAFRHLPAMARPIGGGLAIGGLAFLSPYALTFGEGQINTVLATKLSVGALLLAALCKFVASSTMVSSGWRGGFIIPLFFLGVTLGMVASRELHTDLVVTVAALMVACNVGVTKTPFGSTLVVTGMAGVALLPTTLLAAVVALVLTSRVGLIHTQRERDAVVA
jgi:H+/Cl- antiporter ClcA